MAIKINEEFFSELTPESAYVLGYIWADGTLTVSRGEERVFLSSRDKQIIEDIHNAMDSTSKITEYKDTYSMSFGKPKLIQQLKSFGLTERKSTTAKFPIGVPKELMNHFVRGYFDGNGHFTYEKYKGEKRRLVSGFTMGSEEFANDLANYLHGEGLKLAIVRKRDRRGEGGRGVYYDIRYYQRDTKRLAEMMYQDASLFLKRKKEKYDSVVAD